jgi:hypothetical protein
MVGWLSVVLHILTFGKTFMVVYKIVGAPHVSRELPHIKANMLQWMFSLSGASDTMSWLTARQFEQT